MLLTCLLLVPLVLLLLLLLLLLLILQIPIINENDAIVVPDAKEGGDLKGIISISDNDAIAAVAAAEMSIKRLILLSDIDGVYNGSRSVIPRVYLDDGGAFEKEFEDQSGVVTKSRVGRGGIMSKLDAAMFAQKRGVEVVIANGFQHHILKTAAEETPQVGTFFATTSPPSSSLSSTTTTTEEDVKMKVKAEAREARKAGRVLANLKASERSAILNKLASLLEERQDDILRENQLDMEEHKETLAQTMLDRLKLSKPKLESLSKGLRQLAKEDPLDKVLSSVKVSGDGGLTLVKQTVPIGVLLIIFESRPDALPQIAGLSIASGNALLLKGGKEAARSNQILHSLVQEAISSVCQDAKESVLLVSGRSEVSTLLEMQDVIDLCIPRGSNELVQHIQNNTKIPVMGHADGICHVYVDSDCNLEMAMKIIRDSKTDYPAACNALETLLIHKDLLKDGRLCEILSMLDDAGVTVHVAPRILEQAASASSSSPEVAKSLEGRPVTDDLHIEYGTSTGSLDCTIEVVDDVKDAIAHIQEHGSEHTEVIITENKDTSHVFLSGVDSSCAFHNASSRFSDGFRFGLGAEVGISTARIHARGPVGIEGLLTSKWILKGQGHTVEDFARGEYNYVHEKLPIDEES
eukprot:jgi/Bigna1/88654/estExt_fgenesh1_pg.C_360005